jgi:DNA-binding transcriptional ArsR family regulator
MPQTTLELDRSSLGMIRLTTSPLWEVAASLVLQSRPRGTLPWPLDAWHRLVNPQARRECADLLSWMTQWPGERPPPLLTPVPGDALPTIEDQLTDLRTSGAERLAALAEASSEPVPPPLARLVEGDAARGISWLVDALRHYWEVVLAPSWLSVTTALEEDILTRSRTLAVHGADKLLSSLHERIQWHDPMLVVSGGAEHHIVTKNEAIVLVPLVFGRTVIVATAPGGGVALSYQARGAAALIDPPVQSGSEDDALVQLVGRARASVLRALTTPTTTTSLARVLGLAPSTVSAHLSSLTAAAVVKRRRVGGRVLYELSAAGRQLAALAVNRRRSG